MLQALASREGRTSDSFKSCWCHWIFNLMLFSYAILIFDLSERVNRWTRLWSRYLFCRFLFTKFPLNKRFPFGSFCPLCISSPLTSCTARHPESSKGHQCLQMFIHIHNVHTRTLPLSPQAKKVSLLSFCCLCLIKLLDELLADYTCHTAFGLFYFKGQRIICLSLISELENVDMLKWGRERERLWVSAYSTHFTFVSLYVFVGLPKPWNWRCMKLPPAGGTLGT